MYQTSESRQIEISEFCDNFASLFFVLRLSKFHDIYNDFEFTISILNL